MACALITGGTRGVGRAVAKLLQEDGWQVTALGRADFDLGDVSAIFAWTRSLPTDQVFDLVILNAGWLDLVPWREKIVSDYLKSYMVNALGPVLLLRALGDHISRWARIVFVSSVAAVNSGSHDLAYGLAKAALEKAARALAECEEWTVALVRFDLVNTDMLQQLLNNRLFAETLPGREILEPEIAARRVLKAGSFP